MNHQVNGKKATGKTPEMSPLHEEIVRYVTDGRFNDETLTWACIDRDRWFIACFSVWKNVSREYDKSRQDSRDGNRKCASAMHHRSLPHAPSDYLVLVNLHCDLYQTNSYYYITYYKTCYCYNRKLPFTGVFRMYLTCLGFKRYLLNGMPTREACTILMAIMNEMWWVFQLDDKRWTGMMQFRFFNVHVAEWLFH